MNKFKVGAEITNYGEVMNLIINLINRCDKFNLNLILDLTLNYLEGSSLDFSKKDISRMVYSILETMQKHGYLNCKDDEYITTNKTMTLEDYYNHIHAQSIML